MANSISTKIDLNITEFLNNLNRASAQGQKAATEIKKQFSDVMASKGFKFDTREIDKVIGQFQRFKNEADKAGKDAGDKLGKGIKDGVKKGILGIDTKQFTSTLLGVFGGSALLGGISGIVNGFKSIVSGGKTLYESLQQIELGFRGAGLSGNELEAATANAAKFASKLGNEFAVSAAGVRTYVAEAALLGGVTGKQNEDVTTLAVGIEKATKGMVSGTAVIRAFTRGIGDPEAEANLGRLKMAFPQFATALKGVEKPAEMTQKALQVLNPTFQALRDNAKGPIGSMARLENTLNGIKSTIGKNLIDIFAPLLEGVGQYVVPAIQSIVGVMGSVMKFVSGNKEVLAIAAGAWVAYSAAVWIANGGLAAMGTALITTAKNILSKLVPAIITKTTTTIAAEGAEKAAVITTYAWNAALLSSPITWWVAGLTAAYLILKNFTDIFGKSAEEKLKDAEAESKSLNKKIEANKVKQDEIATNRTLIDNYTTLAQQKNKSAEDEAMLLDMQLQLQESYPGVIKSSTDYGQNLQSLAEKSKQLAIDTANLKNEMAALQEQAAKKNIEKSELKVDVGAEKVNEAISDITDLFDGAYSTVSNKSAQRMVDKYNERLKNAVSKTEAQKIISEFGIEFDKQFGGYIKDEATAEERDAINTRIEEWMQAAVNTAESRGTELQNAISGYFDAGKNINLESFAKEFKVPFAQAQVEVARFGAKLIEQGKGAGEVYKWVAQQTGLPKKQIEAQIAIQRVAIEQARRQAEATGDIGEYRDWETDRKSTRLNSSHRSLSRMPSSA